MMPRIKATIVPSAIIVILLSVVSQSAQFRFVKAYQWNHIRQTIAIDTLLYCGLDEGLEIFDVSEPSQPRIVGQYVIGDAMSNSSQFFCDMALNDNYIYMAKYDGGLAIFDIADPNKPAEVFRIERKSNRLAVKDNLLIVAGTEKTAFYSEKDSSSVGIYSLMNKASPRLEATIEMDGYVDFIQKSGNYLFLSVNDEQAHSAVSGKLRIHDIASPSAPTEVSSYKPGGTIGGVAIIKDHAFVQIHNKGLQVLDISSITDIKLVAEGECHTGGYNSDILIVGNYAFMPPCCGENCVFDISDPLRPVMINRKPCKYASSQLSVSGNYAFVVYQGSTRQADNWPALVIFDIKDPGNWQQLAELGQSNFFIDVAVSGSYAYLRDLDKGLFMLDMSKPPGLELISVLDLNHTRWGCVVVNKGYVYAEVNSGDWDSPDTLIVVDCRYPAEPKIVTHYPMKHGAEGLYVYKNWLLISDAFDDLQILDISNPEALKLIGRMPLHVSGKRAITIKGGRMYVASGQTGLKIIDVNDIRHLRLLSGYKLENARSVAVQGDYAYVADHKQGLVIVNVSNPESTEYVSSIKGETYGGIDGDGQFDQVYIKGNHAFLLRSHPAAVYAIDIANPAAPRIVASYGAFFGLENFLVEGEYFFLPVMQGLIVLGFDE